MRNEHEMLNLIINAAKSDDRVFAAYLKGSRANPNAPKDRYQDFDVMYVVRETESFIQDTSWMSQFGKVVLQQEQNEPFGYGERFGIQTRYEERYSWLLLFEDGNRIDIGVELLDVMKQGRNRKRLFVPLLDKIGCLPQLPSPTDADFYIKKPSDTQFRGCCKEFFWCLCDVAKGIARDELPFAMNTYNTLVRDMLETMLDWYIGMYTDFSVSSGKLHKYFKKYLPAEIYNAYIATYTDGNYAHFWDAIDTAYHLFRKTALLVAERFQFTYPEENEQASKQYIQSIRKKIGQVH